MSSLNLINYSLRQNKVIQRHLVFDCCRKILNANEAENMTFIGFGSIWFPDFQIAHTNLNICKLISIENDDIEFARASFNKPFECIEVIKGRSTNILKELKERKNFSDNPWLVWLDYCARLGTSELEDLGFLIENAPENSIILTTFNADTMAYDRNPTSAHHYFKGLFGSELDSSLTDRDFDKKNLANTACSALSDLLVSYSISAGRDNFEKAIKVIYKDSSTMATVGGIITSGPTEKPIKELIYSSEWEGQPELSIAIPPLTMKEVGALKALLPGEGTEVLTAEKIGELGFRLNEKCLPIFEKYYKYYPSFAQVGS